MDPDRYTQIDDLFQAALEREPEDRAAFLNQACAGDSELRAEVESLLSSDEKAKSFIESPALAFAPELLADQETRSYVGRVVGSHKVIKLLGAGGMGEVYLAEDSRLNRRVALKILGALDSVSRKRFLREARLASALDHPNICTIYEVGEESGRPFISMQYVDGQTLRDLIDKSALPLQSVISVSLQVAHALAAAHARGIIHRDIKSQNIIITPEGQTKVLDFGLARPLDGENRSTEDLTQSGVVQGTPAYMSPEQARGARADHRSDIFSLGVVMYEMATGRLPFKESSLAETLNAIINTPHVAATELNADIPPELSAILDRLMAKQPDRRYQSVAEIIAALEQFAQARGLRLTSLDRLIVPHVRTRRVRFRRRVWGVAIFATLLLAASAVLLRDRFRSAPLPGPIKPIKAVAVLPFRPLVEASRDEALEMGMADTLVTRLSSIREVGVRPTAAVRKYARLEQDAIAAGREQRVDAVLDGSIQKAADRVRVTVRLIRVEDGATLWTGRFDEKLDDIFAVQDAIAERVAAALTVRLTGEQQRLLTKRETRNPEAYQAYLKGRYHWNRDTVETIKKSFDYFNEAVQKDPQFAAAHAGLADSWILLSDYNAVAPEIGYGKAREAATRAIELDETLADPHVSLAFLAQGRVWNWAEAERHYQKAISLNPNHAGAHHWYADFLAVMGKTSEAIAEAKRAIEIEPLSAAANANLGSVLYLARQYDRSIDQLQTTLEIDPNFGFAHFLLGLVYAQKARYEESIAAIEKAAELTGRQDFAGVVGYVYALAGRKGEAQTMLAGMLEGSKRGFVPHVAIAVMYVGLNDKERAFQWLDKMVSDRQWQARLLKAEPMFDPLHSDPRFTDLLRRVGLPG